jgi:hypothetical protein
MGWELGKGTAGWACVELGFHLQYGEEGSVELLVGYSSLKAL